MTLKHVSLLYLLGALVGGCAHDTDGEPVTPTVVAGLRYINLVPDTGGMDIRVIDIVGDAPNTFNATFRTGGSPYGVAITGLPLHTAVAAGSRNIRAFMSSTNTAIASTIMLDTSFTFEANNNYTVYLFGYARATGTPRLTALLVKDSVPTLTTTQFAVRAIHLAPTLAPTLPSTAISVWVDTLAAAAQPTGTPTFSAVTPGQVTAYLPFTARRAVTGPPPIPALNYRSAIAVTASTTPFVQADVPNGAVASPTTNIDQVAGDLIAGSAFSAIIVPPSVAGSAATAFLTPSILLIIDQRPPRTLP